LVFDNNFIDQKYHKYIPILAGRLNKIHDMNHDVFFWKKCLGLGLIRNITLFYDMFKVCEENFSDKEHDCRILSENSYYIPKDLNDQRDFFQGTAYGQEQVFSVYMHLFYPDRFELIEDNFFWPRLSNAETKSIFFRALKKLSRITVDKLTGKIISHISKIRKPHVAIIESFFYVSHLTSLIVKSKGLIRAIPIKSDFVYSSELQLNKRIDITAIQDDFDRFDSFFFTSMRYCFPKIFIEDFEQVFSFYSKYFKKFNKLNYVVNESWIGNNHSSIAMAILQQKGIKHIYNEHNFLSHHFLGNNHKYIFPLVDEFVSLGWYKENTPKLIKGASLFEWVEENKYSKEHEILFVSGQPAVKPPEVSASYGDFGAFNAKSHLEFNYNFFNELKESTLRTIVYRGYPLETLIVSHLKPHMFAYDQEYVLRKYVKKFKLVDNVSPSAKVLMQKSKLIVIDYLSTSYIESMIANIPTIFFWNEEIYPLNDENSGFYEILVSVGICQTNPFAAAIFIEKIRNDPDEWWNQRLVQDAKNQFLAKNFGHINDLKEYLLSKSNAL